MRHLINYLTQLFCKHEFDVEEKYVTSEFKDGTKIYMRCKKCGYHQSHWKFL